MFLKWFLTHLVPLLPHADNSLPEGVTLPPGIPPIPSNELPPLPDAPPTTPDNELPQPVARPDNALPEPPVVSDSPYFNGMKDPVEGGFVTLEEAEIVRKQCLDSGNRKLREWALTVLPFKFAIRDAASQPEFAMSSEDQFSVYQNNQFAHTFYWFLSPDGSAERQAWCPQAFVATYPRPGQNKLYNQGPAIPHYGSFSSVVGIEDAKRIFKNILANLGSIS